MPLLPGFRKSAIDAIRACAVPAVVGLSLIATVADTIYRDRTDLIGRVSPPVMVIGWVLTAALALDRRRRADIALLGARLDAARADFYRLQGSISDYGSECQSYGTVLGMQRSAPAESEPPIDHPTVPFSPATGLYASRSSNMLALPTPR